jgi:hypothetical protein
MGSIRGVVGLFAVIAVVGIPVLGQDERPAWAEIHVVDAATGRGVPLVELETVNHIKFVTDNAGRVAFGEPGLLDREVFFTVRSHGYETTKDGFGFPGSKITPQAGKVAEIKITRKNVAERLCRLTGEGLYRDTILLGHKPPVKLPNGLVAGQDSVFAVPYRGRLWWFWGDTLRMNYPLGLFRMAGARTPIPGRDFDPAAGIPFEYFTDKSGFASAMMPLPERKEGVIWIDGFCTVPDASGAEKLIGHYSRRKGLTGELEHGIAVFNDAKEIFEVARQLPLEEQWRHPHGHAIVHEEGGKKWLCFGNPMPVVRVPAALETVLDPKQYEAFTCAKAADGNKPTEPAFAPDGKPYWRWQRDLPPLDAMAEFEWVKAGKIKPEHGRFSPVDAANPEQRVQIHRGTMQWNQHRKRWVMIGGQIGGKPSLLGEVWYAESRQPTGPFAKAVKVVTHDRQTFYNPCHHAFLDRDGGRMIHFEGTYTSDFSGNPVKTTRYDYNQVLYRLDLDDERLKAARE